MLRFDRSPSRVVTMLLASASLVVGCERRDSGRPDPVPTVVPETRSGEMPGAVIDPGISAKAPGAGQPFEGKLAVTIATAGGNTEHVDYTMKGDKIRLTTTGSGATKPSGQGMDAIIDTDDKKALLLDASKKQFVEVDLDKLGVAKAERKGKVDVVKTGVMGAVAGRSCEEWDLKDAKYDVKACVAKGGPEFDMSALEDMAHATAPAWMNSIVGDGYLPLRVVVSDKSGKQLTRSEITKITAENVDGSAFEVPRDYKKTSLPAVPGSALGVEDTKKADDGHLVMPKSTKAKEVAPEQKR